MRTEKLVGGLLIPACALVLAFSGCDSAGSSGDESGAGLQGTWLVTHAEPIQYDPSDETKTADVQVFEFAGAEVEMVFYLETEQVMGQRGTYTTSGNTLTMTFDEWWNPGSLDWQADDDGASLAFSLDGSVLSITPPGGTEGVALSKTTFSIRPELVKTWYGTDLGTEAIAGDRLELDGTGEFAYFASSVLVQIGPWDASGTHLRSVDDLVGSMGYLKSYTLQDGGSTLVVDVGGGTQVYWDTAPPTP